MRRTFPRFPIQGQQGTGVLVGGSHSCLGSALHRQGGNGEQGHLPRAFSLIDKRLTTLTEGDRHAYGIYLFPYYLDQRYGPKIIGEIWRECSDGRTVLTAVEAVLPVNGTTLDQLFKDFTVQCSGVGPYEGAFPDEGGPLKVWPLHEAYKYDLTGSPHEVTIHQTLAPLSAVYSRVTNTIPATDAARVRFDLARFP